MHTHATMRVPCGKFCGRTAPRSALFGPGLCLVCLPRTQAQPRTEPAGMVRQSHPTPRPARAAGGQGGLF